MLGLPQKEAAVQIGVDPGTLDKMGTGRAGATGRQAEKVNTFLSDTDRQYGNYLARRVVADVLSLGDSRTIHREEAGALDS